MQRRPGSVSGRRHGNQRLQEAKRAAADPRMVAALTAALKDSDKEVRETRDARARPAARSGDLRAAGAGAEGARRRTSASRPRTGSASCATSGPSKPLMGALKDTNAERAREPRSTPWRSFAIPRAVDGSSRAQGREPGRARAGGASPSASSATRARSTARRRAQGRRTATCASRRCFALGQMRDKRAAAALAGSDQGRRRRRARAGRVRARPDARPVGHRRARSLALRDAKPDVREQAAFALGQIRDPRAVAAAHLVAQGRERGRPPAGGVRARHRSAIAAPSKRSSSRSRIRTPTSASRSRFALGQLATRAPSTRSRRRSRTQARTCARRPRSHSASSLARSSTGQPRRRRSLPAQHRLRTVSAGFLAEEEGVHESARCLLPHAQPIERHLPRHRLAIVNPSLGMVVPATR